MKNKVLEIQITDDSPIRIKSLNHHILSSSDIENSSTKKPQISSKPQIKVLPEIKIPEGPGSIKQSPTFDIAENFQITFNTNEKKEDFLASNPKIFENTTFSSKTLEEQINIEKESYAFKLNELCNTRESLKRTISTLEKDSNLEEVIKNNSKKILSLRKTNEQSKTEIFQLKRRVYKAELKIQSVDHEIQGFNAEISELKFKQKQLSINQEEVLKELLAQNEALTVNNKALNEENYDLLSEAGELVNEFINKKEFSYLF